MILKNNSVYGLYVYMRGDGVLLQNKDTDWGVDKKKSGKNYELFLPKYAELFRCSTD